MWSRMQVSQFSNMVSCNKRTHLSNSLLHDTLSGVHAVAEFHLVHPQFGSRWKVPKRIPKKTLQSSYQCDPITASVKCGTAIQHTCFVTITTLFMFKVGARTILVRGERRRSLPVRRITGNWRRGRVSPPRTPYGPRSRVARTADRERHWYARAGTRSIFCKQALFSSSGTYFLILLPSDLLSDLYNELEIT